MRNVPTGTLTFFFSDIEGSTRIASAAASTFPRVLEEHLTLLGEAIGQERGFVVSTEGDSVFAVFGSARDAVVAAVAGSARWPHTNGLPTPRYESASGFTLEKPHSGAAPRASLRRPEPANLLVEGTVGILGLPAHRRLDPLCRLAATLCVRAPLLTLQSPG